MIVVMTGMPILGSDGPSSGRGGLSSWLPVQTTEEACKLFVITFYCFTANTLLLLGRNIASTMLVQGLGASALPYCMIAVGGVVLFITPAFSAWAHHHAPTFIMIGLSVLGLPVLAGFGILFYTGLAKQWATLVYPAFFIAEETIVTLLMLVYWQIAMVSFTKDEAKRLIGFVSMGAALANIANGYLVGLLVRNAPGGSFAIVPLQCALMLTQLLPNAAARSYVPHHKDDVKAKVKLQPEQRVHRLSIDTGDAGAWHQSALVRLLAVWATAVVMLFTCIEFEYSAVLGVELDADRMAEVTANLASLAGLGQICANLVLTPLLLQRAGVGVALLVTPLAYAVGNGLVLSYQSVTSVFVARLLDFTLRYTVNDSSKQMVFLAVPPRHVFDTRTFIDGTLKKISPAIVGMLLVATQAVSGVRAEQLVRPLAALALGGALLVTPLCLQLGRSADNERPWQLLPKRGSQEDREHQEVVTQKLRRHSIAH